ncbi:hypothetical protein N7517_002634 [Penicillium concentricum]|uniref:Uncharacterized protein n=1 Tax=Penicillium concentricum TaxID=293559 RepID=A0A9W9SU48_9EURO|nr:uncharacterized protein N7517_002634 [Penicillium concentricum]KAJ5384723.1 hypothetical protein N7517_002634 [Penicillium concentricum]
MAEEFSVQYPQANSSKSQPASPQAEENVVSHSHDKAISFQEFDEYALVNRTIGFHGQEATFGSMQKSFLGMERPKSRQAMPQSLK